MREAATGAKHHQPIHTRLHIDIIRSGSVRYLVQTLHGFAWRSHTSSVILNNDAIVLSKLIHAHSVLFINKRTYFNYKTVERYMGSV